MSMLIEHEKQSGFRLAGFDTETTGVEPLTDRIVTAAVYTPVSGGEQVLLNPGIPIPTTASDIHGITTEYAQQHGVDPCMGLRWAADTLTALWGEGFAVVGHNVVYDLTILGAEMHRHGVGELRIAGPVLDTLVLDKHVDKYRRGRRNLTTVSAHYGVDLGDDAHNADADAKAAMLIAEKICAKHFAGTSLVDLFRQQVAWAAEQAASLQDYFRRTRPDAVVDGTWPIRVAA